MRRSLLGSLASVLSVACSTLAAGAPSPARERPYDYLPLWSPDGRRIAFERDGALVVMNSDGRSLRQLPGWMPADWSPDGRLVFVRKHADGFHLFAARQDGTGVRRLTSGLYSDSYPHWSPDGRTILFERRTHGLMDIWSVRADGRGLRRLTRDGRSSLGFSRQAWSPDGKRFAYVGCTGRKCGDIYVLDAAGRGVRRRLTRRDDNNSPSWSPDGSLIAYFTGSDADLDTTSSAELYAIRPDGTGRRNLSRSRARRLQLSGNGTGASWSPDGRRIVFDANSNGLLQGASELWIVRRDGTLAHPLLRGTQRLRAEDHVPVWSPDGRRIAFARLHNLRDETAPLFGSIHTVRPDGSGLRRLTY